MKAQILGQVVIFLLAALIFVLVLSYGYRAINSFLEQGRTVAIIDFKNELETAVKTTSRNYGSIRTYTFSIPSEFHTLCIVGTPPSPALQQEHPLLYQTARTGSENIFLLPLARQHTPIFIEGITIPEGHLCVETTGSTTLRFEGLGTTAKITTP